MLPEKYREAAPLLKDAVWRKSTRSGPWTDNCIEVAFLSNGLVAVGDTQSNRNIENVLIYTPGEWDAFVKGAKDGEFDVA